MIEMINIVCGRRRSLPAIAKTLTFSYFNSDHFLLCLNNLSFGEK